MLGWCKYCPLRFTSEDIRKDSKEIFRETTRDLHVTSRTVPIMQCDKLCYNDNFTSMQSQKVSSNWAENANLAILQSAGHRASVYPTFK